MRYLIITFMLFLVACGGPTPVVPTYIPDSGCKVENLCTYASVPGYQCQSVRQVSGDTCTIVSMDYQTTPGCDVNAPSNTCYSGGWGTPVVSYPCCTTIQGPGPSH